MLRFAIKFGTGIVLPALIVLFAYREILFQDIRPASIETRVIGFAGLVFVAVVCFVWTFLANKIPPSKRRF